MSSTTFNVGSPVPTVQSPVEYQKPVKGPSRKLSRAKGNWHGLKKRRISQRTGRTQREHAAFTATIVTTTPASQRPPRPNHRSLRTTVALANQVPVDKDRLRRIYEAHRVDFWRFIASEYGGGVDPALLEQTWRRGFSYTPPTPCVSPDNRTGAAVIAAVVSTPLAPSALPPPQHHQVDPSTDPSPQSLSPRSISPAARKSKEGRPSTNAATTPTLRQAPSMNDIMMLDAAS
jgi:hypothetical protein